MKPVAIFRHYRSEGPGYFAIALDRRNFFSCFRGAIIAFESLLRESSVRARQALRHAVPCRDDRSADRGLVPLWSE